MICGQVLSGDFSVKAFNGRPFSSFSFPFSFKIENHLPFTEHYGVHGTIQGALGITWGLGILIQRVSILLIEWAGPW